MGLRFTPFLVLITCCLLSACAATSGAPPAAESAGASGAAEYVIGPGDVLKVNVLGNPELTTEAPVRPDGKISMPLIKEIGAVGKSPTQLATDIENELRTYLRAPSVSVVVQQAHGLLDQVKVIGQVTAPGSVPFRSGMTVMDAVLEVKGLSQYAAGNRATIIRTVNGKTTRIKVRLQDLLTRGDLSQNYKLQSGDIVIVPEARF
jgi:polysaccharide biosynthesis/export protein